MLRVLAALLIVCNLGYFAWSHGWLDKLTGTRAQVDGEPERLARQVHPEIIRVLASPNAVSSVPAASAATNRSTPTAAASSTCLQAGPFTAEEAGIADAAVRAAVPDLAERGYSNVATEQPGVWAVYMGKFADTAALQRKEAELRRRKLDYETLTDGSELSPGLVLSRHDSTASAAEALNQLSRRGVNSAKVIALAAPGVAHQIRVDKADGATQSRLNALTQPALAAHRFVRCDTAEMAAAPASVASAR